MSDQASLPTDIGFLASAICRMRSGTIVSVARPNSLFILLLELLGKSRGSVRSHIPQSLLTEWLQLGFESPPGMFFGFGYETAPICGRPYRVAAEEQLVSIESLDSLYLGLKNCSAVHVDVADGACDAVAGSRELIGRYKPPIFVAIPPSAAELTHLLELFDSVGYVAFADGMALERASSSAPPVASHLLAIPRDSDEYVAAASRSIHARIAGWRSDAGHLRSRLAAWSRRMAITDLMTQGMNGIDETADIPLRWTGARRDAAFCLFVPFAGSYRVCVEIKDYAFPDSQGLGLLRIGDRTSGHTVWTDQATHRLEAIFEIGEHDAASGCALTMIVPAVAARSFGQRSLKVGSAVAGLSVTRLASPAGASIWEVR